MKAAGKWGSLLVYSSHNKPRFKVGHPNLRGSCRFYAEDTGKVHSNGGEDREEYPIIVDNLDTLYRILKANSIKEEELHVDENSIEKFYGFPYWHNNHSCYFVKPTEPIINSWWNRDVPNLKRYTLNRDNSTNSWGFSLLCWENTLVESGMDYYIDEDITSEEVEIFTKGREDTRLAMECRAVLEVKKLSSDRIKEFKQFVEDYEAKVQAVIDTYSEKILKKHQVLIEKEMEFGLDCGFCNFYSQNEEYNNAKRLLYNVQADFVDYSICKWMRVCLPYSGQSTTVQREIARDIVKIIETELGESLYFNIVLD